MVARDDVWYVNPSPRTWPASPPRAKDFHASLPGYAPTPLVDAPELARMLGVAHVLIKDESARFDLGAFKILGTTWAAFQALAADTGYDGPADLASLRRHLAPGPARMLVSATDGNHGRGVARTARMLGLPAHIFMPAGVPQAAIDRIRGEGATVVIVDANYDGAVATANEFAGAATGRLLVQDTGWAGYTDIPNWIAEGYLTLTNETDDQVAALGLDGVDVVTAPIGVGALGQAVIEHFRSDARPHPARVVAVEPDTAACVLASLKASTIVTVDTGSTIANGLNCGTPSATAWPWMRDGLSAAVAVSEDDLRQAMKTLANVGIASGPSGCAAFAGLVAVLTDPERRAELGVNEHSVVLAPSTEGPVPGVE